MCVFGCVWVLSVRVFVCVSVRLWVGVVAHTIVCVRVCLGVFVCVVDCWFGVCSYVRVCVCVWVLVGWCFGCWFCLYVCCVWGGAVMRVVVSVCCRSFDWLFCVGVCGLGVLVWLVGCAYVCMFTLRVYVRVTGRLYGLLRVVLLV